MSNSKHLQFHIADHDFNLKSDGLYFSSQGSLRKDFRYNKNLQQAVFHAIQRKVSAPLQRRVNLLNDPKDLLDSLEFENFKFN